MKYEAKLTAFLKRYGVYEVFKNLLEQYGSIKNYYVYCENTEPGLAFRSAFAWNCEDNIKGCDGEKFWTHLNSMWQNELSESAINCEPKKPDTDTLLKATKLYFSIVGLPTTTKKFAKITQIAQPIIDKAYAEVIQDRLNKKQKLEDAEREMLETIRAYDMENNITDNIKPESEEKTKEVVDGDWFGMDLQTLSIRTRKKVMDEAPHGKKIRISLRRGSNIIALSKEISDELRKYHCEESMEICVDRLTNRMVFVFGRNKSNSVTQLFADGTLKIQSKVLIGLVSKYLKVGFIEEKYYYVDCGKLQYNEKSGDCAMVITNTYSTQQ